MSSTSKWNVVFEPLGKNPAPGSDEEGTNEGAMIVYVTNGSTRQEVSRVGWVRRNSKNPGTEFKPQLDKEVEKARAAAELLNGQLAGSGELA